MDKIEDILTKIESVTKVFDLIGLSKHPHLILDTVQRKLDDIEHDLLNIFLEYSNFKVFETKESNNIETLRENRFDPGKSSKCLGRLFDVIKPKQVFETSSMKKCTYSIKMDEGVARSALKIDKNSSGFNVNRLAQKRRNSYETETLRTGEKRFKRNPEINTNNNHISNKENKGQQIGRILTLRASSEVSQNEITKEDNRDDKNNL